MLANHSKSILDKVIFNGQEVIVKRHGKPIAKIKRHSGASAKEILESLSRNPFTEEEAAEIMAAIKDGTKALTHGHST